MRSIDQLKKLTPFYVAHRGSGDNWTEHTALAYGRSLEAGAHAIEVSVNRTRDGVFVCQHDSNLKRLTGTDAEIEQLTWNEVSQFSNDAREWLGPAADLVPISRLDEVLDAFAGDNVIFLEDKTGKHTSDLLDIMDAYPDAAKHFVWKQWAAGRQVTQASERGYTTWGYFTSEIHERIDELSEHFDMIGIHHSAPDEIVRLAVETGIPVIVWEVHRRSLRDHLATLGVQGMMCSNIPYVMSQKPRATKDSYSSGLRAAGDLPWSVDNGWSHQPTLSEKDASVTLDKDEIQSYGMGSLSPVASTTYVVSLKIQWPDAVPDGSAAAGIAFCLESDAPYRIGVPSETSGYHALLRANGSLELILRSAGEDNGTSLGVRSTSPPVAGQGITLVVRVSPTDVRVSRDADLSSEVSANDTAHRGGYIALCKNYPTSEPAAFSEILIE
ncbi:glycerophosphodiester phosphodiesterase [Paramicrobacterium chengjingii]|uniref:GP-PDE domain-containing protein n=1 Tax=Paramicrobacterium chengjingii TaxID=2769067 RepID=A0ABX6YGR4_9MICO|nr:glycerophosphodiester phosphodiesterase [Microbacterium chengjingii]QPZ37636.1 hypothetical protein HCR76_12495 [Microbacterium chengjingii]